MVLNQDHSPTISQVFNEGLVDVSVSLLWKLCIAYLKKKSFILYVYEEFCLHVHMFTMCDVSTETGRGCEISLGLGWQVATSHTCGWMLGTWKDSLCW